MRIIAPLEPGKIYHVFNRGINGENIFKEKRNYYYFMDKYNEYCSGILETYAYSLLKNHFHLMFKIKENVFVTRRDGKAEIELNASEQLSHFFNSYAQSINKANSRHGGLFEAPFKRKMLNSADHFTSLVYYIHFNPEHHHFVNDFRDWEFTSWNAIMDSNKESFIVKEKVFEWFGSRQNFINAHLRHVFPHNISVFISQ